MNKIFPPEIVKFSIEDHFAKYRQKTHPVYAFLIILIFAIIAALPFIKIDITYSSRGVLKTSSEASPVVSQLNGIVSSIWLNKNKFVNKGDTLIILEHGNYENEKSCTLRTISIIKDAIHDLEALLSSTPSPQTAKYREKYAKYTHEMSSLENDIRLQTEEFESTKKLYNEGFIARLEYERIQSQYLSAKDKLKLRRKSYLSGWQSELSTLKIELLQKESKLSHLQNTLNKHYVISPSSGYVTDYHSLQQGTYIAAGTQIARIVPVTQLEVTSVVPPDKISWIRTGQDVRLKIDSYPASVFGYINAQVKTIPEDATNFKDRLGFPVICAIHEQANYIKNPSLKEMRLKSGMTCSTMFILQKKSLLQVMIEKGEKLFIPES